MGNIPAWVVLLKSIEEKRAYWVIFREMCIALVIIVLFAFFGQPLLNILELSQEAIYLSGGLVLFIMSVKMIFPKKGGLAESLLSEGEPFIFPLAVPLIAGPAALAAVMIYSKQLESMWTLSFSILIAWGFSSLILLSAPCLKKWLGSQGISALERLMGLILMVIGVNMFLDGIELYNQLRGLGFNHG